EGAFLVEEEQICRLPLPVPENRWSVVMSRNDSTNLLEDLFSKLEGIRVENMHSSLKFCLVAEGTAALYPRMKPSMEWDTAAGSILVQEAGGSVTDWRAQNLLYNREDLKNPAFLAVSAYSKTTIQSLIQESSH